jgi:hypothetical protein
MRYLGMVFSLEILQANPPANVLPTSVTA